MKVILTGGAGFIGSCMLRTLNDAGCDDVIVVDNIASTEKWRNLVNKRYIEYFNKADFLPVLPQIKDVSAVVHLGACSATTEKDFDYLYKNNLNYSKTLWNYCAEREIPFLYASSAATYGDGSEGFDDKCDIKKLRPLNGYGYSKQLFDLWAEKQAKRPPQHVGMKFFNVYGPNEYFKGSMASVIFHSFNTLKEYDSIKLFKSYLPEYAHGEQRRDFVYVKDICSVIKFFLEHPDKSGLFNLGTGHAQSFNDLAKAVFHALDRKVSIEYTEMPEGLRAKYQYFTEADIEKLRNAGYDAPFAALEEGAGDYVRNYLAKDCAVY